MFIQKRSDYGALYACAFAVNETDLPESRSLAFLQVFLNHAGDVPGLKRMKIKNIFRRKNHRSVKGRITLKHRLQIESFAV